ncbi:MAG: peptidoglycan-binding protein [Rhizobiaceae bacterium]|nr:peptidoglycan-binding protein [Rhizobiaceae bacterium]
MRQSARQLEEPSGIGALLREGLLLSAGAVLRNPLAVGGTTAFLVAFGFVSANALWYQPHFHDGAFFSTRTPVVSPVLEERRLPAPEAMLRAPAPIPQQLERPPDPQPTESIQPQVTVLPGDATVARVQMTLRGLDLYRGEVDGLPGPQTSAAVTAYQRIVGLAQTGEIDGAVLAQLGIETASIDPGQVAALPDPATSEQLPIPAPRPQARAEAAAAPDPQVVKIQAGLRAFGNDGIELDGRVGNQTRRAIEEFQSLFGLPVTGKPDDLVFAKMREIGLTD